MNLNFTHEKNAVVFVKIGEEKRENRPPES